MLQRITRSSVWRLLHQLGVAPYFSAIYWAVRLERKRTLSRRIGEYEAEFVLRDRHDYHRVESLMGEAEVIRLLVDEVEPDDVLFDVGGNIGTHACFAAKKLEDGKLVAFEPSPNYTDKLAENLSGNSECEKVFQIALAASNGFAAIDMSGHGGDSIAEDGDVIVATRTGAGMIQDGTVPVPEVMKIDVEGAELEVVRGFGDYLKDVRTIVCEVHPEKMTHFDDEPKQLEQYLREMGFRITDIGARAGTYHLLASRSDSEAT